MSGGTQGLDRARRDLEAGLARCAEALGQARGDDALLALRDLLLDWQFESRQLITTIEERLGAFAGDDSPDALAVEAEGLIEQIEGLQDAWETRVDLLLDAGFDEARIPESLAAGLAGRKSREQLVEVLTGLPADMDQTSELLDYAKRYLLSLVVPPPRR